MYDAGVPLLDIADCAANLPVDSAVYRTLNPDWEWGLREQLLALLVDEERQSQALAMRLAGVKGVRDPKPIPRPGVTPEKDDTVLGGGASVLPIDEMAAWLGQGFEQLN
jgi:hypothetical protein